MEKFAVFDFDELLVQGRVIDSLMERIDATSRLEELRTMYGSGKLARKELTYSVAKGLEGVNLSTLEEVVQELPVVENFDRAMRILISNGFSIGIITDGYLQSINAFPASHLFDRIVAHKLIVEQEKLTGEVEVDKHYFSHVTMLWKGAALLMYFKNNQTRWVAAVGHGDMDASMLQAADLGVALHPSSLARGCSNVSVEGNDLAPVAEIIVASAPK